MNKYTTINTANERMANVRNYHFPNCFNSFLMSIRIE